MSSAASSDVSKGRVKIGVALAALTVGLALGLIAIRMRLNAGHENSGALPATTRADTRERSPEKPTFTRDIAPIIFEHCAGCHRPEQTAPFSLLTFEQVRKHAQQVADLTARHVMPPWPPEPGYGRFLGERRLSESQITTLQRWQANGTPEGDSKDLPATPVWAPGWQGGEPDLVIAVPQPYTLTAEGQDIYRNFVVPIPNSAIRYVRGVEFRPGNARVVHHAFLNLDETRQSRYRAGKSVPPGFDSMDLPDTAIMPAGQLLGWQPGKFGYQGAGGLPWILKPNTDLVLQLHLQPSGKPEVVQPSVGLYFTDQKPEVVPYRIRLVHFELNIPPGESNYVAEQSYVLPVDVSLLRVNPHAHYLGKDLQGYALLPDGEKRWLIWIRHWDFNWQGDYPYAEPIALPKGSKLVMRFTYDNSTNNLRNPNHPPKWIRHGPNTMDEMAALGFQAVTKSESDRQILAKDGIENLVRTSLHYYQFRLGLDPNDFGAHLKIGRILSSHGNFREALPHLQAACQINPKDDTAHYELGYLHLLQNQLGPAEEAFQNVVRLNPNDGQAFGNLGLIAMKQHRLADARESLQTALRLNPDDQIAQKNLELVTQLERR